MPFAKVRDITIYYEIRGKGPRLLSLSGTGADLRRSPNIFEMPVAKHFEILGFDQRGLGRTSRPDAPYSMLDYAQDTVGLMDAVGWGRAHVIGISFGGMVAQELAIRYPERIERLVLACTSSGGAGGASHPLHELASLPQEEYVRQSLMLSDTRMDEAWQTKHPAEFKKLVEQRLAGLKIGADEPDRKTGQRRQLEARAAHDTYDRLPQIRMPVFICGGRYDGIARPSNLEALYKQIPNSRLEFFEGGHQFHIQDPRAYESILAFLKGELDS